MDSVTHGVGASQVWPYLQHVAAAGHDVELLSFEPSQPGGADAADGIRWAVRPFERRPWSPLTRVALAARVARSSRHRVLHARSDLPALASMVAGHPNWIWDMRAFWREQRIYLGSILPGSPSDRVMRRVEHEAAARSSAIVCLADAAKRVLLERHGADVAAKVEVIPTAVDLTRFAVAPRSAASEIRILLSGTYNRFYDVSTTTAFVQQLRALAPVRVRWVGGSRDSSFWHGFGHEVDESSPNVPFAKMPELVATSDVGIAICQADGGAPLTAAMPTKIAEFLACGRPVVVNAGLGDMDRLVAEYGCGVSIDDRSPAGLRDAATRITELVHDPELPERARQCAEDVFDLRLATDRLARLYDRLAGA